MAQLPMDANAQRFGLEDLKTQKTRDEDTGGADFPVHQLRCEYSPMQHVRRYSPMQHECP